LGKKKGQAGAVCNLRKTYIDEKKEQKYERG